MFSDIGSLSVSQVITEVAEALGITLQHATTKHAQIIGMLERSHASLEKALKNETGERRSMWHKHVNIAVLIYKTSFGTSIGSEPSRVFRGCILFIILDLKLKKSSTKQPNPNSLVVQDILWQVELIFQDILKNAMQACIKYKAY